MKKKIELEQPDNTFEQRANEIKQQIEYLEALKVPTDTQDCIQFCRDLGVAASKLLQRDLQYVSDNRKDAEQLERQAEIKRLWANEKEKEAYQNEAKRALESKIRKLRQTWQMHQVTKEAERLELLRRIIAL